MAKALAGRSDARCLCHPSALHTKPTCQVELLVLFLPESGARLCCATWLNTPPPPPHSPTSFQHLAQPGPPSREGDYHSPDGFPQRPVTGGRSRGGASFKHRHWLQQWHYLPVTETLTTSMGPIFCWCFGTFFLSFSFSPIGAVALFIQAWQMKWPQEVNSVIRLEKNSALWLFSHVFDSCDDQDLGLAHWKCSNAVILPPHELFPPIKIHISILLFIFSFKQFCFQESKCN